MAELDDMEGGPAFPTETANEFIHGMSLRDWFAGQVLPVISARYHDDHPASELATLAYQYADAMLKARTKEPTP